MKTALIFGAGGQAGYYMTKLLASKGYEFKALTHKDCDVTDDLAVDKVLQSYEPDEVYNFAALDKHRSNDAIKYGFEVNALAVLSILQAYKNVRPDGRFFQAGSADVFDLRSFPQSESSPIQPAKMYGVAKAAAMRIVDLFRHNGMYACTGILFNMVSNVPKLNDFAKYAVNSIYEISIGKKEHIKFGDLGAIRDWGLVEEYVEAMWLMLQPDKPNDYVIGTGVGTTCENFVKETCKRFDVDISKITYTSTLDTEDRMLAAPYSIYRDLGWVAKTSYKGVITHLIEGVNVKSLVAR